MYIQGKGKGWIGVGTALGWNGMIYLFFLGGGDLRGGFTAATSPFAKQPMAQQEYPDKRIIGQIDYQACSQEFKHSYTH